jgi:hypothetical protein
MGTREAPLSPVNERLVGPVKVTDDATVTGGFDAGGFEAGGLDAGGVLLDEPEPPPHAASSIKAANPGPAILARTPPRATVFIQARKKPPRPVFRVEFRVLRPIGQTMRVGRLACNLRSEHAGCLIG